MTPHTQSPGIPIPYAREAVAAIIDAVFDVTGVPPDLVLGQSAQLEVVLARTVAMYAARQITFRSYPELAGDFCRANHSTVVSAVARFQGRIDRREMVLFKGGHVFADDLYARVRDRWALVAAVAQGRAGAMKTPAAR